MFNRNSISEWSIIFFSHVIEHSSTEGKRNPLHYSHKAFPFYFFKIEFCICSSSSHDFEYFSLFLKKIIPYEGKKIIPFLKLQSLRLNSIATCSRIPFFDYLLIHYKNRLQWIKLNSMPHTTIPNDPYYTRYPADCWWTAAGKKWFF